MSLISINKKSELFLEMALLQDNPLSTEILLSTSLDISQVEMVAKRVIIKHLGSQRKIQDNLSSAKIWAKSHKSRKSKIADVILTILESGSFEEAQSNIELYFESGGTLKDIISTLKSRKLPIEVENQAMFLEVIRMIKSSAPPKHTRISPVGTKQDSYDSNIQALNEIFRDRALSIVDKDSLFHQVCILKRVDLLEELIKIPGYSVDARWPETGHTPLHFACLDSNKTVLNWLISHSADLNAKTVNHESPLHLAASKNESYWISKLCSAGAFIDSQDINGHTPLHVAAFSRNEKAVTSLLDNHADINIQNHESSTAAHLALARAGNTDVFLHLVRTGACIRFVDGKNSPVSLLLTTGDISLIEDLFKDHKVLIEIIKSTPPEKRLDKIRDSASDLLSDGNVLEVVFLIGDPILANLIASQLEKAVFDQMLISLKEKYPGADLSLVEESGLKLNKQHIVKAGNSLQVRPPKGMSDAEWKEKLREIECTDLLELFDRLNFSEPEKKGHILLTSLRDENGDLHSPEDLRVNLQKLLKDVTNHVPKIGTPSIKSSDPKGDLTAHKELFTQLLALFPEVLESEGLDCSVSMIQSHFDLLIDYVDPESQASDITESIQVLKVLSDQISILLKERDIHDPRIAKLQEFVELTNSINRLFDWYSNLNTFIKADVFHICSQLESSSQAVLDEDPTPFAGQLLEFTYAGGKCGTRYLDVAQQVYQEVSGDFCDLNDLVFAVLQTLKNGIAERMVDPTHPHNVHHLTKILQVIDEDAGITDDLKMLRFYFQDTIPRQDLEPKEILRIFYKCYFPTAIIDRLHEEVHSSSGKLSKEVLLDWFKENIPKDWDEARWRQIKEDIEGLSKTEAAKLLNEKYSLFIDTDFSPAQQVFEYFLSKNIPEWNLEKYTQVSRVASAMSLLKQQAVKFIESKYSIILDANKPLQEQIRRIFIAKLEFSLRNEYFDISSKLESLDSFEEQLDWIEHSTEIPVKRSPSVTEQLGHIRTSEYLSSIMEENTGKISREALIYFLSKVEVFTHS